MHKHASTNRFYRLVWSHVHSCWVAVAEGARGRGKSASRKLTAALVGTALSGAALAAPPGLAGIAAPTPKALPAAPAANALPTGAQVVAGQASVTQAANQMTVHQGSDKAILNWQSFDIGANAGVRFVQPNANAVALNRVLGNDPSRIYGQLSANGKVFLVNGSGVLFGASARVDVGGLIASSLALPDGDFLAGRYTFSGSSNAGAVRNEGSIRTSNGGYVALLGPSVANKGSIVAPNGSVALGAGEQIGVDLRGDGLITLRVDRGAVAALANNSGLLQADGGRVELSAKGADALARATVNNTGVVQARGLVADGGSIRLVGDGEVQAGTLDASSRNGKGGAVAVEGRFVALDGTIDASGVRGGSVDVNAAGTLSTAAATSAVGRGGDGGAVSYRSTGMVIESSSASVDASGFAKGGSIGVQGDSGVLSSSSYSARSSTGVGGQIDVSGDDVRLLGAQLDASGNTQGGLVRVGGAFQGGAVRADAPDLARFVTRWGQTAPIANATSTFVSDGSAIKVGATGRAGQGGTAVVWSDKQTTMLGSVDARGAGAAGTVEISSKDELRHVGLDRIALGTGGQLLLDPKNITIGSSGSAWTYQAVLGKGVADKGTEVGNLEGGDGFGMAVALNAAGTRLAVGAPYDDGFGASADTARERGAVHLFSFTNANFAGATLQGTIGSGYSGGKNLNVALDDMAWFGSSVALNADATRLAVGASMDAGGLGSVRMFSFGGDQFAAPALTATLRPDGGAIYLPSASAFGTSVALNAAGDRLAVGAAYDWGANGACGNCGAVYLFNNALATPTFVKGIGAGYGVNMALPGDAQFGTSVAFDGSGDRLAVGAYGVNNASGQVSAGAVYLFNNPYGATSHVATLGSGFSGGKNLNLNLGREEGFGSSVAFNSAGTRLAVGATGGNGNVRIIDFVDNQFSGAAVTATLGSGNTEGSAAEVGLETSEWFGSSVALNAAGDRLVVGSPFGDGNPATPNYGYGTVRAFGLTPAPATSLVFGGTPSANATIDAGMLESALDSGTSITLQANNDITLEAGNDIVVAGGSGNGSLTLQAGRSIALNSTIITGNADLTLVANEKAINGVVNVYRDAGAASITTAAGTTINAGSGRVSMTIADGAGRTGSGSGSGAITIGGNLLAGSVSVKNLGTSANSNVVIGAGGSIQGTGNGLIEVATTNADSTFLNYAGAAGIDPGAGRYLVYSNNPMATLEGLSGYKKHYSQAYAGSTPVYASNGNWFLYSITPTLTVNAAAASRTYDGSTALPELGYGVSGFIDGDNSLALTGSLSVTGLTRNAGTYAIDIGSLGNNLGYAIIYTGANFTITPRVLNATAAGINKTYDGNNIAGVNFGDDRIVGDVLSYDGVARFSDKHAGTGKTVNVTGITIGGTHAANYTLASNSATTSADIAKRTLTASAIGLNKTYDGGTAASVLLGDDRISGDVLSLSADSASFADKNAGVGKTVTVTGIALGGGDSGNYALASTTVGTHADIGKRVLNANAVGLSKTYDGGTAANVLLGDDRMTGDVLSLSADSASFADKNAGSGKTVTVSGIALEGQDAGNYALASTNATTSANIDKRTLSALATGVNKTYDGSNAATVSFTDDRVTGDVLAYTSTASFADKNAGNGKTVSVSGIALGGQDAGNYELGSVAATTQADIAKRTLVASATGVNKTYDGSTSANVVLGDDRVLGDDLSLNAGSASFADKNAGLGKAVTVSGIAMDGQDAGNYALASTAATTSANIDKRGLNATATGVNKTYDGGTAATVTFGDDRVTGDVLEYSANASFADKNAGNGKAIAVSGIALGGQDAGNYALSSTTASASADIAKRTLTASATGLNKTYDGGTAANVVLGDDRVLGDDLSLSADSASFADKNAGTGKAITVTGIALDGQDAGNYALASTNATTSADIAKRSLSAVASGVNKTYDGSNAATVNFSDDRVTGDVLAYTSTASFADKNAGNGKTVSVSGIALEGQDAGNYALGSTTATTQADIAKRTLVVGATGMNKTYDGSTAANVVLGDDRVAGDLLSVNVGSASFADKNAGSGKAIAVSGIALGGQDAGNYTLDSTSAVTQADIAKRLLTVGATGVNKTYDGGTTATVTFDDDRVAGDVLGYGGNASFADKNAGNGKAITVTGIALSGQDAGNYALASTGANASADIAKRTLHAQAAGVNKTYDGSNAATVSFTDDRVTGDVLAYTSSASFADKNAGNGKTVSVTGVALGGQDAGNYALASTTGTTQADIAKRTLVVGATGVNKTYDGGTAASVTFGDDRVAGDVLAYTSSASFADKNAGSVKTVSVSGIALGGQDAGNYALASATATTSADIAKRTLVVGATGVNKTYDGGTAASVTFGDDRVAGDVLAYTSTASFADKNAGNGKAVSVTGIVVGGQDAGNYALASTSASTTADIGRRVLNAQTAGVDKVYDGSLGATVRFGDDRVAGDVLAYTSTASFADKNAGNGKAVTVTGIALGGQDAGNYTLSANTGTTTASIARRVLNVGASGIDKVYDGSTVASVTLGDDRVAGDRLALTNGGAAFADKNAGTAKAIQVNGIALGGQDAANYTLASTSLGTSAAITPRTLQMSATGVDKVYDGGTAASVVLGDDRLGTDQLSIAGNARFADKSAGSGKAVQVNGLALSGLDAGNYRLAATTLSTQAAINQATLTVKANNATRAAGLNNPVFGYSVSGLVQGDSPAILPAFVTASNATPQSAPGSYAITVGSSATMNDYKLAFVDGMLTVTGAPPELTRAIRATIAPVLPLQVSGGTATVAHQQNEQQQQQQRDLPRVEEVRQPGNPAPISGPRVDGAIVTLSGGTEVLTRNGGVRSAQ